MSITYIASGLGYSLYTAQAALSRYHEGTWTTYVLLAVVLPQGLWTIRLTNATGPEFNGAPAR